MTPQTRVVPPAVRHPGHSAPLIFRGGHREVKPHLVVEVGIEPSASKTATTRPSHSQRLTINPVEA
jgi:hypothetical protein